jgi:membrane-associated protease RseP (regulator of RpoE activity)
MMRTVLLVGAGLAAGLAAAYWLAGSLPAAEPSARLAESPPPTPSELPGRIVELERQLGAEIEKRTALEQRVGELGRALDELHAAAPAAHAGESESPDSQPATASDAAAAQRFGRNFRPQTTEQRVSTLEEGGFSPDRAAWIEQRRSELQLQAMQAQYAQRRGESVDPALLRPEQTLRGELGDADYEKYLEAQGRPTKVGVYNVLPSSPAAKAGMQPGDQIVSYAGQRVFNMADLTDLTLQGTPGQSVTLEVQRNQQNVQLVIPRGPIGIGAGPGGGGGGQFGRRP